jgi:hypothetical protein
MFGRRRRLMIAIQGVLILAACGAAPPAPSKVPADPGGMIVQKPAAARLLAEMGPNTPIDTKVARLIDRLVLSDRDQVQAAATALILLGDSAVPSIIRRIDDRRDMPAHGLSFENRSPNAFEGVRHYGVEKVVDALNDILNDITGVNVGYIDQGEGPKGLRDNAGLESQRKAVVDGWRAYLARRGTMPPVPGKSLPPVPGKSLPSVPGKSLPSGQAP